MITTGLFNTRRGKKG